MAARLPHEEPAEFFEYLARFVAADHREPRAHTGFQPRRRASSSASNHARIASLTFAIASRRERPWLTHPGRLGTWATNQPPSSTTFTRKEIPGTATCVVMTKSYLLSRPASGARQPLGIQRGPSRLRERTSRPCRGPSPTCRGRGRTESGAGTEVGLLRFRDGRGSWTQNQGSLPPRSRAELGKRIPPFPASGSRTHPQTRLPRSQLPACFRLARRMAERLWAMRNGTVRLDSPALIRAFEVQPKLRIRSEGPAKTHRGVRRDSALADDDLADESRRAPEDLGKVGLRPAPRLKLLL